MVTTPGCASRGTQRGELAGVQIRPIEPSDTAELERFYEQLSDESRWYRFLGATRGVSHGQSASFCTPDHEHREGFVAVAGHRIVGHVCVEPTGVSGAEVAIAVADAWQRQGIGRRLMRTAIGWARTNGIDHFVATMAGANVPIQRLLAGLGLPLVMRPAGDVIAIRLDLRGHAEAA